MRRTKAKIGFTKVDHVTSDIVLPLLTTAAQSIFLRIYRQTIGWNKKTDRNSNSQLKERCHIKHSYTIREVIMELKELDLISVKGRATQVKTFSIKLDTLREYSERHLEGEQNALE